MLTEVMMNELQNRSLTGSGTTRENDESWNPVVSRTPALPGSHASPLATGVPVARPSIDVGPGLACLSGMDTMRKILVPVDFGELSEPAIEKAIEFATAFGGAVTLLHVYEYSLWGIDGGPESAIDSGRRIRQAAEKELDALVTKHRSRGVEVTGLIRMGIPWSETLNHAQESGADLIVVGTHGRRGLPRALLGSVAEKIVRCSTVPVLTIRGTSSSDAAAKVTKGTTKVAASKNIAGKGLAAGRHDEEVLAVSGAVAGAVTGSIAGPPGAAAGAIIGTAIGMAIGRTLDDEDARKHVRDEELDRQIGVSEGDLGAAARNQPPARVDAYSAGSAGVGASSTSSSEGLMQSLDED
jgi:nucleotide-binding universal stress UspA family protein